MSTSDAEDPRRFSEAARRIGTGKQRDTSSLVNPASSSSPTVNPASYKEEAENPAECNETGEHDAMGMSLRYSAVYSQHDNDEEAVSAALANATPLTSPFMSFALRMRERPCRLLPAVCHADSTARLQTVSAADGQPWLAELLTAVGDLSAAGLPVLINTSFNTKGKPIIKRAAEALHLLRTLRDFDYVVIGDWLFDKAAVQGDAGADLVRAATATA